jgi:DNA topoisomerase IA
MCFEVLLLFCQRSGHDAGDHPPITPLKGASEAELGSHDAWRLYQFVTQHFLASVGFAVNISVLTKRD